MNRLEIFERVYGPTEWSEAALLRMMKVSDLVYAEGFNAGIEAAAKHLSKYNLTFKAADRFVFADELIRELERKP